MKYQRHRSPQRYTAFDVALLANTDELNGWLSGPATKKILERENTVYGYSEYTSIAAISVAKIYRICLPEKTVWKTNRQVSVDSRNDSRHGH